MNDFEKYLSKQLEDAEFNQNFDVIVAGFDQNRKDWYFGKRYAEEKGKFPIVVAQIQYCVRNSKCITEIANYEEVS